MQGLPSPAIIRLVLRSLLGITAAAAVYMHAAAAVNMHAATAVYMPAAAAVYMHASVQRAVCFCCLQGAGRAGLLSMKRQCKVFCSTFSSKVTAVLPDGAPLQSSAIVLLVMVLWLLALQVLHWQPCNKRTGDCH